MLQDISYGKLENEFYHLPPKPEDYLLCFQNHQILVKRKDNGACDFPTVSEAESWISGWSSWYEEGIRYVFRMQEKNYFLWLGMWKCLLMRASALNQFGCSGIRVSMICALQAGQPGICMSGIATTVTAVAAAAKQSMMPSNGCSVVRNAAI